MQATHGAVNTATEASTNLLQTLFKVPIVPGTHEGERLKKMSYLRLCANIFPIKYED
jgi:hypothetical protein